MIFCKVLESDLLFWLLHVQYSRKAYKFIILNWQVCVEGNIASGKTSFLNFFKNSSNVEVSDKAVLIKI